MAGLARNTSFARQPSPAGSEPSDRAAAQVFNSRARTKSMTEQLMSFVHQKEQKLLSSFVERNTSHDSLELSIGPDQHCRRFAKRLFDNNVFKLFTVTVIMLDFALTCMVTDLRAAGQKEPLWIDVVIYTCLAVYTFEIFLRIFVWRQKTSSDDLRWMVLDCVVLLVGYADVISGILVVDLSGSGSLRLLRVARAFRMLRLIRGLSSVTELRKLLQMFASCFRTLAWSFIFCFIVMTVFSMVAVELINPIVQELAERGQWADCKECVVAFSSVFHSNLTLFSTIVAGDSWGKIAIPVVHAYPAAAIIFIGSCLVIVYGVLNLIIAVVVDSFAERRARDEKEIANQIREDWSQEAKDWTKVFKKMDTDESGDLSFEELLEGARTLKGFRDRLRILDIDEADLEQLFKMLDADSSGAVDADEFIGALIRWKYESKSASRFVKFNMEMCLQKQEDISQLQNLLADRTAKAEARLAEICRELTSIQKGFEQAMRQPEFDESVGSHLSRVHVGTDLGSQASGQVATSDEVKEGSAQGEDPVSSSTEDYLQRPALTVYGVQLQSVKSVKSEVDTSRRQNADVEQTSRTIGVGSAEDDVHITV